MRSRYHRVYSDLHNECQLVIDALQLCILEGTFICGTTDTGDEWMSNVIAFSLFATNLRSGLLGHFKLERFLLVRAMHNFVIASTKRDILLERCDRLGYCIRN